MAQPAYAMTPESVQQMIVHALFADAAAAVVLTPDAGGLEVVDITSVTDTTTADMMTWDVGDHGFVMGLSAEVPGVVGRQVRPAVDALLSTHGLAMEDISGWAIHPGGPAILDAVAGALELSEPQMQTSRDVLAEYGNCSSPTVLLILERVESGLVGGDYAVALGFGPGLTLFAALLRMR
jgi:predicted naringenin-chalcone synthase